MRVILISSALVFLLLSFNVQGQEKQVPLSQQMSLRAMEIWPDSFASHAERAGWTYEEGLVLTGITQVWQSTGDGKWFDYLEHSMDYYVKDDGSIREYDLAQFNLDDLNNGRILLTLYEVTGKEKYKKAVQLLYSQLEQQPRTKEGSFWHKKIYPSQVWLDGLYMAQPFYAAYARRFHIDTAFNDIARQFIEIEQHNRDVESGLLRHGWDESRQQQWADKSTGSSPMAWGRAMGWYAMALVDVLDQFPKDHPKRAELIAILRRLAEAVSGVQDPATGLWFNIPGMASRKPNYPEASASCMLTYAIAKGTRMGYLPAGKYEPIVRKAYAGIVKKFVSHENGRIDLKGTVSVSGLGGQPFRDGSFDYYMREPVVTNDPKGIAAFILCATEMEHIDSWSAGMDKIVLLDRYYNSEKREIEGRSDYYHYTWEEKSHPGFFTFGHIFQWNAASLSSLDQAPTQATLDHASVYIIVDPDHEKDKANPNYMNEQDAKRICDWVKKGGVLLVMGNDAPNADITHINKLISLFGIEFNADSRNAVPGDQFEMGALRTGVNEVFPVSLKIYMKEISTLKIKSPASALLTDKGDVLMATAKFGKGAVFVVGDPWIYNEYVDGRRLRGDFQNYAAATDLARWLLNNATKTK